MLLDEEWMDSVLDETVQNYILSKPELCGFGNDVEGIYRVFKEFCQHGYEPRQIPKKLKPFVYVDDSTAMTLVKNCSMIFLAKINCMRHIKAGITGFIWMDCDDKAVCSDCQKRNGVYYSYYDSETIWPGVREGCRCIASPVFD
ncbi:minor capsid protein [Listeria booriae]|uniref:minor capsid protein n=1 Tax=Listeria booriae TaxID=1552123 RepID=UPI00162A66DD|nr:minor capsid protein [Listeria booriae]MBC1887981.1 minor capsid protein [Listeria booriae]